MRKLCVAASMLLLAGCAMASDVMDTGNGTYLISARASAMRGGAAGANQVAYKDAQAFCAGRGGHAVVIAADSRDVAQSSFSGSANRNRAQISGGTFQSGNADMRFRCQQ